MHPSANQRSRLCSLLGVKMAADPVMKPYSAPSCSSTFLSAYLSEERFLNKEVFRQCARFVLVNPGVNCGHVVKANGAMQTTGTLCRSHALLWSIGEWCSMMCYKPGAFSQGSMMAFCPWTLCRSHVVRDMDLQLLRSCVTSATMANVCPTRFNSRVRQSTCFYTEPE